MRNVKKSIDAYYNYIHRTSCGWISASEAAAIFDMSRDWWDQVINGFAFGFMAGYRRAKRELRRA